ARKLEDGAGEFMPAALARGGEVVKTVRAGLEKRQGRHYQVVRARGRADLVVYHVNRLPFFCQVQHQLHEAPPRAARLDDSKKTPRANHEVLRARRSHEIFSSQLAGTVGAHRPGKGRLRQRRLATAIQAKDVVGAEMDQDTPQASADD